MHKKLTKLNKQLYVAFGSLVAISFLNVSYAQTDTVVVTGSSIKRAEIEGALPIQSYNAEAIKRSGATSAAEFIQSLPVMQGFTHISESVGGGGGGFSTASIHDLGSGYTLVLLNGRRLAPANSGNTVDLNTIPIDAIERVEVLTDGASSVYGSDAIAGVVNFIMKKGKESPLSISVRADKPEKAGGKSSSFSLSKGFGDYDKDGFSVWASYAHKDQSQLKAADRDFAKTGIINFNAFDKMTGKNAAMQFFNGSSRSIPANATVYYNNAAGEEKAVSFNPYQKSSGQCPPAHKLLGTQCYFDYTSTVEIAPESKTDSLFLTGKTKLGQTGFDLFTDLVLNKHAITYRIAPYPAEFAISKSSPLYSKYIAPNLSAEQIAGFDSAIAKYRLLEVGGRAQAFGSDVVHWVGGIEGQYKGWDLNSALTLSSQTRSTDYKGGWPLEAPFMAAVSSGKVDPFAGSLTAEGKTLLNNAVYNGNASRDKMTLTSVDLRASREVAKLSAGAVYVALGADATQSKYTSTPSSVDANAELLFGDKAPAYGYSRPSSGVFTEVLVPVAKGLEVTGSVRYDSVGKMTDELTNNSIGNSASATTHKVSTRYQAASNLLVRGSFGTGFKAPSMLQLGSPLVDFGVTGGSYNCPLAGSSNPLASLCDSTKGQLEMFKGGNANLKPERSNQLTFGFVTDPVKNMSISVDYWKVDIKDAITSVSEELITSDPVKYANLYTSKFKTSTGKSLLAIKDMPINIGQSQVEGVDWSFLFKNQTGLGTVTNRIGGTYLIKSRFTTPGTDNSWESSLGNYGSNNAVSFRNILNASSTLQQDKWTHTVAATYRSAYRDKNMTYDECAVDNLDSGDCANVQLRVKSYTVASVRSTFRPTKNVEYTFAINNLFDAKPGLTLRSAGSHQLGYDPRYTDPYGRTFNFAMNYKFN
jgi:iron complex outermembrane receptor protein